MAETAHPLYESHRGAMAAAMRQRLDLAEAMLRESAHLSNIDQIRQEVMDEFELSSPRHPMSAAQPESHERFLHATHRFYGDQPRAPAARRVTVRDRRDPDAETYKAQLLTVPEAERLASGRQFPVTRRTRLCCASRCRNQARQKTIGRVPGRFLLRFRHAEPGDNFDFGINYKACGLQIRGAPWRQGNPANMGLISTPGATRGIHLERTQTPARWREPLQFRFSRRSRPE